VAEVTPLALKCSSESLLPTRKAQAASFLSAIAEKNFASSGRSSSR
jgi:hypothetical protein